MTVWCVEDDAGIRELVVYTLESTGFSARGFGHGAALMEAVSGQLPDLLLLDVMLPGQNGISLLQELRAQPRTARLPVIILTAKGAEHDKVLGLDSGADDYIAKPFGMMELVSRIQAVLRRAAPPTARTVLTAGRVSLDPWAYTAAVSGKEVSLTHKEFELLRLLLEQKGLAVTREKLLDQVWGYRFDGGTRTIDMHVKSLRKKLGEEGDLIRTVRGVGYRLQERDAL